MKKINKNHNKPPFYGKINKSLLVISMILIVVLMSCSKDDNSPEQIINTDTVSTLAGSTEGFADGKGAEAQFSFPTGIVIDGNGTLYVTDSDNFKIRKITPFGDVTTLAGSEERGFVNGVGSSAKFDNPFGIAIDSQGNLFVAEVENDKIRKITPNGTVTTFAGSTQGFADGIGTAAKFHNPYGICIDSQDNIYVTDFLNRKIRKITPNGEVTTFAGSTTFGNLSGIAIDNQNNIYVVNNDKILKITPNEVVSTLAGGSDDGFADGEGINAKFDEPIGVAVDGQGNVYVCDAGNSKIRKITPTGVVSTLAGSEDGFADGSLADAKFSYPTWLTVDAQDNVYVTDSQNSRIRKITQ